MTNNGNQRLVDLEEAIKYAAEIAGAAKNTVITVEYEAVSFVIGRHFVSADLTPLQFFHLVEHIGDGGAASAILRLQERLLPLLTCNHQWTDLKRTTDAHVGAMVAKQSKPQVCRLCTAYASADTTLPIVGKSLGEDDSVCT